MRTHSKPPFPYSDLHAVRASIKAVLEREPELNPHGFGTFRPTDDLAAARADALTDESCREFEKALAWLQQMKPTSSLNRSASSYSYKHNAECWLSERYAGDTYASNGMLIAAAMHLGLKVKRIFVDGQPTPNARINLPTKRPGVPLMR